MDRENELSLRQQLQHLRWLAFLLLCLMILLFVMSTIREQESPLIPWLRSFAEAAMVGALADWFAVTALFRHPLGLPIPHTAIIPANKERVADHIGRFIAENFLAEEAIEKKLSNSNIAQSAGVWLAEPENSQKTAAGFVALLPDIVGTLNDEEISRFLRRTAEQALRSIDPAPAVAQILNLVTSGDRHEEILDSLLNYSEDLINRHQAFIRDTVREAMPWYVPKFVHDQVYASVVKRIKEWIHEINSAPDHDMRLHFREATQDFIADLQSSPRFKKEGERIRDWLITHPALKRFLLSTWGDIKTLALADAAAEDSKVKAVCAEAMVALGNAIKNDGEFQSKLNARIANWGARFVGHYGEAIAEFVADTVREWDDETIVDKLELSVGRDLQYIRLNGTIVGGLIGLLVHAARLLLTTP